MSSAEAKSLSFQHFGLILDVLTPMAVRLHLMRSHKTSRSRGSEESEVKIRRAQLVALIFGLGALLTGTLTLSADNFNARNPRSGHVVVKPTPADDSFLQVLVNKASKTRVPETGTLMLLGTGLFSVAGIARRRLGRT